MDESTKTAERSLEGLYCKHPWPCSCRTAAWLMADQPDDMTRLRGEVAALRIEVTDLRAEIRENTVKREAE